MLIFRLCLQRRHQKCYKHIGQSIGTAVWRSQLYKQAHHAVPHSIHDLHLDGVPAGTNDGSPQEEALSRDGTPAARTAMSQNRQSTGPWSAAGIMQSTMRGSSESSS